METEDSESRSSKPTEPDDELEVIDAENARRDWLAIGKQAENVYGIMADMSDRNPPSLVADEYVRTMRAGHRTLRHLLRQMRSR